MPNKSNAAPFRAAVLLVASFVVLSCATPVETAVQPRSEVVREELVDAIESGEPERAVQRIGALRRQDVLSESELEELMSNAVERIRSEYGDAVAQQRHQDAIRWFGNLVAIGATEPDPSLVSQHYLSYAIQLYQAGNRPAALGALLQAPSLSDLPTDTIERAIEVSVELNNRYAASLLIEILGRTWQEAHPEVSAFASGNGSPVEMSQGVVTVWVNRGLRLQNGMGIPDRVIGSGFFIDARGYIVTNYHVISSEVDPEYEGYSRLFVRLPSDPAERIPARVVGYSPVFDVAMLKVEVDAPYVFSFTDIRSLEPGSPIMAIGSPGGLENSISSGIISAVGRRFLQMGDAMQVDVPVNPGSSGGPLLDQQGRLVGVVFAGLEQFEGVNFAIPAYWVSAFLPDLYQDADVTHPWMGIAVEEVRDGLEVSYVANDSPAAHAGLQVGDVITKIDDWTAGKIGSAQSILLRHRRGALIELEWMRDDASLEGLVSLEKRPLSPVEVALQKGRARSPLPRALWNARRTSQRPFVVPELPRNACLSGKRRGRDGITQGDTFSERGFEYDDDQDVVFLRMFIQKRTEGFMRTAIQLPAFVERDNFL